MATKNEDALVNYLKSHGADWDLEARMRASQVLVALDGIYFEKAKDANQPAAYRAYIRDRRAERLIKTGPLVGRKFDSIGQRILMAKRLYDDALFANALNAKVFRALEALPEQALSGHLNSAAITEACKRRLSAAGSQIKGVVVAQWLDKCSDNESVMMALNWTSGRTKYSASTYPAWLALSKASIPESLLSNVTDWIIEQEVMRQLKEGTLDSIKAFLKQSSAARPLAVLKLRHDELLPPCPDGDRASCALTTISEKLAYLNDSAVYLSNCLVCKARTVLENRRPILVKELSSLVRKRCHSIAQTTQRQLVRIVNG